MAQAELSETVHALLRAAAELSREQSLLDQDPERTTAPRDHAMQKAVAAFREFEAGAKAARKPLAITIRLTPGAKLSRLEKHSVEPGRRPAIENAARTFTCKAAFASASALPVWELETRAGRHRHYQPQNGPSRQKPILETLVCTRGLALNRSLGALSFFRGSVGVATITALPANVGRGRYFANLSSLRLRGCWCCDRFALCTLRSFPNYGTKHQTKNLGVRSSKSLRARQYLAPTFRAKNTAILRILQGTKLGICLPICTVRVAVGGLDVERTLRSAGPNVTFAGLNSLCSASRCCLCGSLPNLRTRSKEVRP